MERTFLQNSPKIKIVTRNYFFTEKHKFTIFAKPYFNSGKNVS